MADNTSIISASTLNDTPGASGLLTLANSDLAPLLENEIVGFTVIGRDNQRRAGRWLDVVYAYEDVAPRVLTDPFVLAANYGRTADAAVDTLLAFQVANPDYWFSDIRVVFTDLISGQNEQPYLAYMVYSQDSNAGDNWISGGTASGGVLAGDVTGAAGANTVERIRNRNVPVPVTGGARLVYDSTSNAYVWYARLVYASLAAAAADQGNQYVGVEVIVYNDPATSEDGTYRVNALTGVVGDFTKINDTTDTAAEVGIVDAGGYYSSTDVEGALQEIGASSAGTPRTAL